MTAKNKGETSQTESALDSVKTLHKRGVGSSSLPFGTEKRRVPRRHPAGLNPAGA